MFRLAVSLTPAAAGALSAALAWTKPAKPAIPAKAETARAETAKHAQPGGARG
jgi:hypothetical protein